MHYTGALSTREVEPMGHVETLALQQVSSALPATFLPYRLDSYPGSWRDGARGERVGARVLRVRAGTERVGVERCLGLVVRGEEVPVGEVVPHISNLALAVAA